jgi:drug/metabolite transporter (DMT)-like permease
MTRLRADFLLLTAALIWGTAFVAQKVGNGMIGPFLFVAGRFTLSALLLIPLAWREARSSERLTRRDWMLAGTIGVVLCALATLQQIGLTITSVTNAGFITSLYIAFVPFVGWLIVRAAIRPLVLGGVAVSLLGAWLLAGPGQAAGLSFGDVLVLISAIITSLHIVLVSLFLKTVHRPFFLSFMQYSVTAVLAGVIGFSVETTDWHAAQGALPTILYAGLLSGGVGFTLQIVAQRYTPATEAALIMSLESVFAAIAAAVLLGERLTMTAAIGCGLVMLGVVLVEIVPLVPGRGAPSDKLPPLGSVPLD